MGTIYLKITRRCNIRCDHCFIREYEGDMSPQVIAGVAQSFPLSIIVFHGGEPTLAGVEYIEEAISVLGNRTYILQSNMIDFAPIWIPLLKKHFESRIGTSLDTSRMPYIDRWLSNIRRAANNSIHVTAVVTITADMTVEKLAGLLDRFEEAGGTAFRLQFVTPVKTPPVSKKDYVTFIKTFYDHPLNENRRRIEGAACFGAYSGINGGNCGRNLRTIDPDGTVYICPDLAGQGLFPLGNVLHDDAQALIRAEKMFFERERRLALECDEECWRLCRGGCLAAAYFQKGDYLGKDPYCSSYKEIFSFVRGGNCSVHA
jgi:radical SAM protein with 4Fe4S-binding SPASM domain